MLIPARLRLNCPTATEVVLACFDLVAASPAGFGRGSGKIGVAPGLADASLDEIDGAGRTDQPLLVFGVRCEARRGTRQPRLQVCLDTA